MHTLFVLLCMFRISRLSYAMLFSSGIQQGLRAPEAISELYGLSLSAFVC